MQARLTPQDAHEVMTTGRRYGAGDAVAAGIVQQAVGEDEVLSAAIARAESLAEKDGPTLATIKQRMYAPTLATLRDRSINKLPGMGD